MVVPISIRASESAFNIGGRILDAYRSSLLPKMVQALTCTQDWLRTSPQHIDEIKNDLEQIEKVELLFFVTAQLRLVVHGGTGQS
ncbi:hypothetical protein PTKIN_Ptkin01aG0113000 [Pterospermum kingtungense]